MNGKKLKFTYNNNLDIKKIINNGLQFIRLAKNLEILL